MDKMQRDFLIKETRKRLTEIETAETWEEWVGPCISASANMATLRAQCPFPSPETP